MSSSSSSSSSPPVVPQHCSTVPVLYEMLKCEEESCRMWLRDQMNQIPEPLIDSLFHGLICSSSSSVVGQSSQTISELCQQLQGEMGQLRMVLRAEMDRLVNTLTERLTNKLRMANEDLDPEKDDGGDRAQVDQVESPTPQPSTSTFNPVAHQQPSNGDEVQLNTVEMIEIKEEVEDGEETRIIDMETLTEDRQVKREIEQEENEMTLHNDQIGHWVKREIKEEEEDGEGQIVDIEGWAQDNQGGDHESRSVMNASIDTTQPHGQSQLTVTQSAELLSPSTSTAQTDNPTALNQQATASTGRNGNKRRQPPSNRSAKRSKPTIDDGEDGEDIGNEDQDETKVKVLHLNCTQSNCNVKLDSLDHLHDHLSTVHQLSPLQCFAQNCDARFDEPNQLRDHIKLSHSRNTRFLCPVCPKEYDSQKKSYNHWYKKHLTGQFECNLAGDCAQVTDTRRKMRTHQLTKHHSQSKNFYCSHPGCTASFAFKDRLKTHEQTHFNNQPFHCNWHQCNHRTNRLASLIRHIRTQHFGLPQTMKAQKAKNIVDLRDPNEYVRVVVDE